MARPAAAHPEHLAPLPSATSRLAGGIDSWSSARASRRAPAPARVHPGDGRSHHSVRRAATLDRALGFALRQARDHQSYLHLGFVRLADYAAERLGMSLRSVQELIRVEEALVFLPRTAAALEGGAITASHVRLLSRVATAQSEPFWLARARRMRVRSFRRAVASARERAAAEIASGGGEPAAGSGAAPSGTGPAHRRRPNPDFNALDEVDREDERVAMTIRAPAWLLRWWRETVTLANRITGNPLPSGEVLEVVLAEAADAATVQADPGRGGSRAQETDGSDPPPEGETSPEDENGETVTTSPAPFRRIGVRRPDEHPITPEAERLTVDRADRAGTPHDRGAAGPHQAEPGGGTGGDPTRDSGPAVSPPPDPRELDARLRKLVAARQRCEAALADHLACARAARSHLVEGFRSLEAYASRRLGLAPRRMYHLLSLHRILERLPGLRRAYLDGRLTLRQALLVGRVASVETVRAWMERAEAVTLRRLEDEVEYWELLRVERLEVWERLRGGPLPEDLVLVPGHEPRLHAPARAADGAEERDPTSADAGPGLHRSAPGSPVDARAFLAALQESEARTPLPQRMGTLRMRVEPDVHRSWRDVLRRLRSRCDGPLQEWEALALMLRRFWKVWDHEESRRKRREHKTLERDGWRCTAPGCRAVGSGKLHEHHIIYRSAGGPLTDPANLTAQCSAHHQRLLHRGVIRCRGEAPDHLRWEMGVGDRQQAFLLYAGDRRTGGTAPPARLEHHILARVTPLRQ